MILVDSSIWIDHLRASDAALFTLLDAGAVACHPFVIGEVACGHLRDRARLLTELSRLPQAPLATHTEAMALVDRHRLFGRGVGWADVHLLASVALAADMRVWSADKRLMSAAAGLGLDYKGFIH